MRRKSRGSLDFQRDDPLRSRVCAVQFYELVQALISILTRLIRPKVGSIFPPAVQSQWSVCAREQSRDPLSAMNAESSARYSACPLLCSYSILRLLNSRAASRIHDLDALLLKASSNSTIVG